MASKVFSVLVVGDDPQEIMEAYDINKKVERYKKYEYLKSGEMRKNNIRILEGIVSKYSEFHIDKRHADILKERLAGLNEMSDFDYYRSITEGMYYDENGDAWSDENPDGKWLKSHIGRDFSLPFKLKDGSESYQSKVSDVDWEKMHMFNTRPYEILWETIVEGREPQGEEEQTLYDNMKGNKNYFESFKSKEEYVTHNCAYWAYAYVDKDGWHSIDDGGDSKQWVSNFYERFVKSLNGDDTVSMYECSISKD